MGETTGITWTNSTLNPIIGCQRVSPGCELCYAEVQDARGRWDGGKTHWGPTSPRYRTSRSTWNQALRWNRAAAKLKKRHLVFCASLSDVFEDHPLWADVRPELFALIRATPALTWLVLTKRPENIAHLWPATIPEAYRPDGGPSSAIACPPPGAEAWPNVWLGTTVEDRKRESRLDELLAVDAALHWVSAEPLLEAVDLRRYLWPTCWSWAAPHRSPEAAIAAGARAERKPQSLVAAGSRFVRWVIAGGESDLGAPVDARPFDLQWARELAQQCKESGTPFFMKQKGSTVLDRGEPISCLGKGDEPALWPPELQRQEFPMEAA